MRGSLSSQPLCRSRLEDLRGAFPWHYSIFQVQLKVITQGQTLLFKTLRQCSMYLKLLSRLLCGSSRYYEEFLDFSFSSGNFTVTSREKSKHWPPVKEYFFKQSFLQAQTRQINGSCLISFSSIIFLRYSDGSCCYQEGSRFHNLLFSPSLPDYPQISCHCRPDLTR